MTTPLIAFTISIIVTTVWLNILTTRLNRLRLDLDAQALSLLARTESPRTATVINTAEVLARLRAREAINRYETKRSAN